MKLLEPFLITTTNCGRDFSTLEPGIRDIFTKSALITDPAHSNIYAFVLDPNGQVIHQFHGLPGGRGGQIGRSDYKAELAKAYAKLKLPVQFPAKKQGDLPGLPDLNATDSGLPAGVRLFIRQQSSKLVLVEAVPMNKDQWQAVALPAAARLVDADVLRNWLVWLYPAAIRAVDEAKRFEKFAGSLTLEPAGGDDKHRYAMLRGEFRLNKGSDTESAFEGNLQVLLTYSPSSAQVQSVRGIIEGDFLYRIRGNEQRIPMKAAIESRPQ